MSRFNTLKRYEYDWDNFGDVKCNEDKHGTWVYAERVEDIIKDLEAENLELRTELHTLKAKYEEKTEDAFDFNLFNLGTFIKEFDEFFKPLKEFVDVSNEYFVNLGIVHLLTEREQLIHIFKEYKNVYPECESLDDVDRFLVVLNSLDSRDEEELKRIFSMVIDISLGVQEWYMEIMGKSNV